MEILKTMGLITEKEFCELMKITPRTAAAWRYRGQSPTYSKVGNEFFYRIKDIEVFIAEKIQASARGYL